MVCYCFCLRKVKEWLINWIGQGSGFCCCLGAVVVVVTASSPRIICTKKGWECHSNILPWAKNICKSHMFHHSVVRFSVSSCVSSTWDASLEFASWNASQFGGKEKVSDGVKQIVEKTGSVSTKTTYAAFLLLAERRI